MTLQELKNAARQLSVTERLELVNAIIESLSNELNPRPNQVERMAALSRLRGIAKTDVSSSNDPEFREAYEVYLMEKYK